MIWSIIPEEIIFSGKSEPAEELMLVVHSGRKMLLRQGRIETLLSTEPLDFLSAGYAPGQLLDKKKN